MRAKFTYVRSFLKSTKVAGKFDIGLFANVLPYANKYIGAVREGSTKLDDTVAVIELDQDFKLLDSSSITQGEDPRCFSYRGIPYALTWDPYSKVGSNHFKYKVINLLTKKKVDLTIDKVPETPVGRLGKNWIPYVKDDDLYFILSIEPELSMLKCDIETGFCEWETEYKEELSITLSRGGTPMVYLEEAECYVGFGHRTHDCHNHKPFLYGIGKNGEVFVDSKDMEVPRDKGVYDPLSLYWKEGVLYCCVAYFPIQAGDTGEGWTDLFEVTFDEL